jgi:hypothetical protein
MARWLINPKGKRTLTVRYETRGQETNCGDIRVDTPEAIVLDWVLKQTSSQPWDTIHFRDGRVATLMATGARS